MGKIEDSKEVIIRMLEKLRSIFHPHRLAQFTNLIELTFQPKILPLRSGMQKSLAEESKKLYYDISKTVWLASMCCKNCVKGGGLTNLISSTTKAPSSVRLCSGLFRKNV